MDEAKLRAWWWHKQGLDGRLSGATPQKALEETGWARAVGGDGPYLTLLARAGTGREAADAGVAKLEIHELPSVRGCTYVLPASDFALGLKAGEGFHDAEVKVARKLGVTDAELEKLCGAIVDVLSGGPLDPDQLREATGNASRSLGEEGKKKGLSTTMPVALGMLQEAGEIRRVPVNGRLDQQRYRYTLWRPNPLQGFPLSREEAYRELARRYFQWIGPATLAHFQWFTGLSAKVCKAAIEPLGLEPLASGDARLLFPADREKLEHYRVPEDAQFNLISPLDGIVLLRRDLSSLVTPQDLRKTVPIDKHSKELGSIQDLPCHGIIDRGRLVGLWEYDPAAQAIVWMSFVGKPAALKQAVSRMEEFIQTDLGDARSFSLDSPKSRVPRIEGLRQAAGK